MVFSQCSSPYEGLTGQAAQALAPRAVTYQGLNRFLSGIKRPSTELVAREIWELLSEGPVTMLISRLCDRTGYSAHTVRQTLCFLERFGKLQKADAVYELNPARFAVVYRSM